jgi:hypothetical protein
LARILLAFPFHINGSLSGRVTDTLLSMVPTIETYSIDESFLNLGEFSEREVEPLARELRERVRRWVGISLYPLMRMGPPLLAGGGVAWVHRY